MASKKDRLTAIEWYRHGELGNTGTMDQKGKADAAQSNISAWQSGETPANVWDDSEEFKMEVRSEPVSNSNSFTIPEDVGNHIVPQVERWSSTEELNDQEEELRRGSWGWRLEATEDNRTSGSQKHDATGKHDVSSALLRMTSRIASNDWDRSERGQASFASAAHEKVDHSGYAAWGKSKAQKGRCWESLREVSPIERWKDYEASIWQKKADSSGRMLSDGGNYGKWNFDERRACKSGSVVKLQSSSSQSNKKYSRCGYSFFQQKQAVAKKSKTKKEEAGNMEYARFACRGKEQNTSTFGACSSFASIKVDTWDVTKDETNDKAKWNKYVDAAGWNGNDETWATCSAVSKTKVEKTDEEYRTGIEKAPAAVQEKKNKAEKKQEVTNAFSDKSEETSLRDGWTEVRKIRNGGQKAHEVSAKCKRAQRTGVPVVRTRRHEQQLVDEIRKRVFGMIMNGIL
ncbi:hypothetical protein BWQ96_10091 [Gracilariopsis chorda]|uniref:Uncharacterized protein n=1 Tax=Gracilariopsis chorda TaxID=448386 RepID=A0A2V3IDS6_9FLOR|nr:hypothetical protein BWQ96_10091 [Gracilariopsis chorda]|eukprot:PXF40201.1 hypothetical protein BWQ96_10091 [Gracilariopsis chorda]